MRIAFFGDSLTQGTTGVNYVQKVAAAFPAHEILNRGVNGDTSLNLYRRVQKDVIDSRPDVVYVMVGINDALSMTESGLRPYYRLAKGVSGGQVGPTAFRENLRAILSKLIFAGIVPYLALPPVEYRPAVVEALRQNNLFAREVCAELNVPVLDLFTLLTPAHVPERPPVGLKFYRDSLTSSLQGASSYERLRAAGGFHYTFDGIHLTEGGASTVAAQVIEFLQAQGVCA